MTDEAYMTLALSLAKRAKGLTHPNPTVGCVVVKNGKIVGRGFHEGAGKPHAEVVALSQAGKEAQGSILYVTLEPCTHFGRTPPCTDAILRYGVKRVVVAVEDPNPLVGGKGIKRLKEAGLEVTVGVLEEEARLLNEDFFTYVSKRRPYITLKLAQSADGKTATPSGNSKWISSEDSRRYAHKLRSEATAILVGINTVLKDNPSLTIRHFPSPRQPLRVVLDPNLRIDPSLKIASSSEARTLLFHRKRDKKKEEALSSRGVELIALEDFSLGNILEELYRREVVHLLVEGGAKTVSSFLKSGLWDRMIIFQAPKLIGDGISIGDLGVRSVREAKKMKLRRTFKIGQDIVAEYIPLF